MAPPNDKNTPPELPVVARPTMQQDGAGCADLYEGGIEQEYTKMAVREEEQVRDASAVVRRAADYYSRYAELTTLNSRFRVSAIPTLSSVSHRSKFQMIR